MHKNSGTVFWEDEIGATGKITPVEPEAKPRSVQQTPKYNLWFRVLLTYGGHDARARGGVHNVGHEQVCWD